MTSWLRGHGPRGQAPGATWQRRNDHVPKPIGPTIASLALLASLGSLVPAASAGEVPSDSESIKPGDQVRVTKGPAPIKDKGQTLTTVEEGSVHEALAVQGKWIKISVVKGGETYTGWIDGEKHLCRVGPGQWPPPTFISSARMRFVRIPAGEFRVGHTDEEVRSCAARWDRGSTRQISGRSSPYRRCASRRRS